MNTARTQEALLRLDAAIAARPKSVAVQMEKNWALVMRLSRPPSNNRPPFASRAKAELKAISGEYAAGTIPKDDLRRRGCEVLAKWLGRAYEQEPLDRHVLLFVNACKTHGSKALIAAAMSILDEDRDKRVRNVFALAVARAKREATQAKGVDR